MAEPQPLINPTLRLLIEPARRGVEGRGKGAGTIKRQRLARQRTVLREQISKLESQLRTRKSYAGKTLIVAEMFSDDSLAPTHTPTDLFSRVIGCELVAPLGYGYLIEIGIANIPRLRGRVESENLAVSSDVSRVKSIYRFSRRVVLRGRSVDVLWDKAAENDLGKHFLVWLRPFHNEPAREALLERFNSLIDRTLVLPNGLITEGRGTWLAKSGATRALRQYRTTRGVGRAVLTFTRKAQLARVLASGTVFRIDPVVALNLTSGSAPREGSMAPALQAAPTVAVVDGGLKDPNYLH